MPRIIPIKDLKDTSGVSELCHSMKEPIYITKNGYGDMVIMSMELFEELNNDGVTIVMITHEPEIADHAKRVMYIRDGMLHSGAFNSRVKKEENEE